MLNQSDDDRINGTKQDEESFRQRMKRTSCIKNNKQDVTPMSILFLEWLLKWSLSTTPEHSKANAFTILMGNI